MRKNTCIVDTMYTLSQYLVYMSESDIRSTVFVVGDTIPQAVCEKLPRYIRIRTQFVANMKHGRTLLLVFYRALAIFYNLTILRGRKLFAQDHLLFSEAFIGRKPYVLMEDAPGVYSLAVNSSVFAAPVALSKSKYARLLHFISYGSLFRKCLGMNPYCTNRWVTDPQDVTGPYIKNKKYELIDLKQLWANGSDAKKKLVLDIIGLDNSVLLSAGSKNTILLTQPLIEDCHLTAAELTAIWSPIVNKYGARNIVIKPHPRDKFDYTIFGEDIYIMKTKVPMQVLCMLGVRFDRAITVCSTAVSMFGRDVEVIKLGSQINPKIAAVYG